MTLWTVCCPPDSCPWDSPGKNTGVGCHFFLQGIFRDPGIEPRSPALQADYLPTELQGNCATDGFIERCGGKSVDRVCVWRGGNCTPLCGCTEGL